MAVEDLFLQLAGYLGVPTVITVTGIILGYFLVLAFVGDTKKTLGGNAGYLILSPLIGILISASVYYILLQIFFVISLMLYIEQITLMNLLTDVSLGILAGVLGISLLSWIKSNQPLIKLKWENILFYVFYSILTIFLIFLPINIFGSFTSYSIFTYLLSLKALIFIIVSLCFIEILEDVLKNRRKRRLNKFNYKEKPKLIFCMMVVVFIFLVLSLFLYPDIEPQNIKYGSIEIYGNFQRNYINVSSHVSQDFIIKGGLINWFPIFYNNINNAMPFFDSINNQMSNYSYNNLLIFNSNKTSKPLTITINGTREINETYGTIKMSDIGQTGTLFNFTLIMPDGKNVIEINRYGHKNENSTTITYNAIIFNTRGKNFVADNNKLWLERLDGICKHIGDSRHYSISLASGSDYTMIYLNFFNYGDNYTQFNFTLECR